MFGGEITKQQKIISEQKLSGQPLDGSAVMFKTANTVPLISDQVSGLLKGSTRLYLLSWASWAGVGGQTSTLQMC